MIYSNLENWVDVWRFRKMEQPTGSPFIYIQSDPQLQYSCSCHQRVIVSALPFKFLWWYNIQIISSIFLFFILEYSYEYADHGWLHLNTSVHIIYSTILFLFIFIQVNAKENCSLELPFYLGTCCAWIRDKDSVLVIHSLAKIHPISYPHSSWDLGNKSIRH